MSSPRDIKTEDFLYTRESHSPTEWPSTPTKQSSTSQISIPQARMPIFSGVPVSKLAREGRKAEEASYNLEYREPFSLNFNARADSSSPNAPQTPPRTPSTSDGSRGSSPSSPETPTRKVARPPNAFMIFRSWWLKQNEIPKHIEKRQQALSRVAGQVWGLLEESEKRKWHLKASEIQRKHKEDNPDYKFIPSPRGSRRNKDKAQALGGNATTAEDQTKLLRETYTKYTGPSPIPTRKKQAKKSRSVDSSSSSSSSSSMSRSAPAQQPSASILGPAQGHDSIVLSQPNFGQLQASRRPSALTAFGDYSQAQFSVPNANGEANKAIDTTQYTFGNSEQMMFGHYDATGTYQTYPGSLNSASWTFAGTSPHLEAKMQGLHQQLAGPFSPPPPTVLPTNDTDASTQIKELFNFPALDSGNFNLGTEDDPFLNAIFRSDAFSGQSSDAPALQLPDAQDFALHLNQYDFHVDNIFQNYKL